MGSFFQKSRKTNLGRWSHPAPKRDLSTIAFFRAAALLRRNGPVPGILAAQRPGANMDKSERPRVAISTKPAETTAVSLDPLLQNLTHTTRHRHCCCPQHHHRHCYCPQ